MRRQEEHAEVKMILVAYTLDIAIVIARWLLITFQTLAQDGYPRKLYEDICAAYGSNYSECETDEYENAFSRVLGDFLLKARKSAFAVLDCDSSSEGGDRARKLFFMRHHDRWIVQHEKIGSFPSAEFKAGLIEDVLIL
jgi:hypothetical protein